MKVTDLFLTKEQFEIVDSEIAGVLKTTPVPSNISHYYDSVKYISHHQDSKSLKEKIYKFFQSFNLNYKVNILRTLVPKNAKVLDYGAGAGEFIKQMEEDFQTFAYEPSPTTKKILQEKLSTTKIVEDLELIENNSLDAITLWHVLEHIEKPDFILNLFHQKLKQNGFLILALPNFQSYDAKHYKSFWAAYDVPRHLFHYSKKGIENLLDKNYWSLENIKPLHLDAFYISVLSEKYKKTPLFWLFGGIIGAISNFKAVKSGEFSSLIYIIRKK